MEVFKKVKNIQDLKERCYKLTSHKPPHLIEIEIEGAEDEFIKEVRALAEYQITQDNLLANKDDVDIDKMLIRRIYIPECGNITIK